MTSVQESLSLNPAFKIKRHIKGENEGKDVAAIMKIHRWKVSSVTQGFA